jgi:membrane dipeptidase
MDDSISRIALLMAFAAALFAQVPGRIKRTVTDTEVMRVHQSAILIDTHNDVTSATVAGLDIGKPNTGHMTDIPRMKKGGMGAQFFAVYVSATYVEGNHSANRTLQMIDTVRHDIIEQHPNEFVFATTAADIRRAHERHKIAALMGIEGGHAIEDSLRLLRDYYDLGVRYMTLTHGNSNHWADSSGDANKPNNGLSPFESGGPSAIGLRRTMPTIPMACAAPWRSRAPPWAEATDGPRSPTW